MKTNKPENKQTNNKKQQKNQKIEEQSVGAVRSTQKMVQPGVVGTLPRRFFFACSAL
jgi:hypothetical protein